MSGQESVSVTIDDEDCAYHEARHAAVSLYFDRPISEVVIETAEAGGMQGHAGDADLGSLDPVGMLAWDSEIGRYVIHGVRALAGGVATELAFGDQHWIDAASDGDRCDAADAVQGLFAGEDFEAAFHEFLAQYARGILQQRWHVVDALAAALTERGRLIGDEAKRIAGDLEMARLREAGLKEPEVAQVEIIGPQPEGPTVIQGEAIGFEPRGPQLMRLELLESEPEETEASGSDM